jgi:hypothetical protein
MTPQEQLEQEQAERSARASVVAATGHATPTPPAELLTLHRDDLDGVLASTRELEGQSKNTILLGPPGTGKTTSAVRSAAPGQEVIVVTMHAEGTAVEFTGHKEIQGGKTVYWEGLGVQAWRKGALLVINEIDNASEDILNHMYQLLDDDKIASIQLPDGEVVRPAPGFRVIATTNGRPEDLPEAIRDRFGMWLVYAEPSKEMYARLDPDVEEVLRDVYAATAKATTARDRIPYVTYRQAETFCDLRRTGIMRDPMHIAQMVLHGDGTAAQRFVSSLETAGAAARTTAPASELITRSL